LSRTAFALTLALGTWACGAQQWSFDVEKEGGTDDGPLADDGSKTCLADEDCPDDAAFCDRDSGVCDRCRSDADCASATGGHACLVATGECVQCTSDAQCSGTLPYCEIPTKRCVQCLTNGDCGRESFCVSQMCTQRI
jgi:hypothetical protein